VSHSVPVGCLWQGQLVRLRAVQPSDWETFHAWDQDTDAARQSYFIPFPRSPEGTQRWTEETALRPPEGDAFRFAIETLAGDLVGTLNTTACNAHNGTFAYGIAIGAEHRRKGYASEAIALALRYYFAELRYQKAHTVVYSFNEPSLRLHEHLGFVREGCQRRMIYTNGQYYDAILFGITAEEFAERLAARLKDRLP
jgi:RimJ/RimL family protein N-acetyltransferase